MKATKMVKTIIMAPENACLAIIFGAQQLIFESIAHVTDNDYAEQLGKTSKRLKDDSVDAMLGRDSFDW